MVDLTGSRAWNLTRRGLTYVAGAVIAFFFVVLMMIATAQQDVLTRMKAEGLSVGYSTALALRREVKVKEAAIQPLEDARLQLSSDLDTTQSSLEQTQRDFDTAWEAFQPSVARLIRANLCDLSQPATDTPGARAATVNEVLHCQLEPSANAGAGRILQSAQTEAQQFAASSRAHFTTLNQLSAIKRQLAFKEALLNASRTLTDDQQKAARSFGDMDVLLQPWVLLGNVLVQFPPPLLQILLTFVSGFFGALLVTLILIVYPNTEVSKASKTRAGARTALGGFIAICVYIVILSGTAVLGSNGSGNGAGTNYMAFSGIGILAGMFSDRVAGWLSAEADKLFKQ